MQSDPLERERIERNIQDDRAELRRALRDLGLSVLLGLNLPRRIRNRPLPWLGALGIAAFLFARRQRKKRAAQRSHWWNRGGAQA